MVMTCYKKLYNFFKVEAAVEMLAVFHGVCPYNMIATQYTLYITASLYFTSLVPVLKGIVHIFFIFGQISYFEL